MLSFLYITIFRFPFVFYDVFCTEESMCCYWELARIIIQTELLNCLLSVSDVCGNEGKNRRLAEGLSTLLASADDGWPTPRNRAAWGGSPESLPKPSSRHCFFSAGGRRLRSRKMLIFRPWSSGPDPTCHLNPGLRLKCLERRGQDPGQPSVYFPTFIIHCS